MPVAGEDAVLHRPPVEREAEMGTAVVERVKAAPLIHHEDGMAPAAHHFHALALELIQHTDTNEIARLYRLVAGFRLAFRHHPSIPRGARRLRRIVPPRTSTSPYR